MVVKILSQKGIAKAVHPWRVISVESGEAITAGVTPDIDVVNELETMGYALVAVSPIRMGHHDTALWLRKD